VGKRLGGIAEGKSLSFRKGVCKGKGYRFCREGLARYACPSLVACADSNGKAVAGDTLKRKGD
jgi:hypothetical protein